MPPWPPQPVRNPIMHQRWADLTFIHWSFPPQEMQRLLPPQLVADTFAERAWLGLTPFRVENLRLLSLPSIPWLSTFPETNLRTYVRAPDGSRGIWFFSLEADRAAAVLAARAAYGLPYRWASMRVSKQGSRVQYHSSRPRVSIDVDVEIGEAISPGERELFLTARYRLYALRGGQLCFADVEHAPWPLHNARLVSLRQDLISSLEIAKPEGAPLVHYSPGVDTKISVLRKLRT